jgi:hypothetical protein
MASVTKNLDQILARTRPVRDVVRGTADDIAGRARAILAAHRESGDSTVTVEHDRVDSFVVLDDPNGGALAIEFGRGAGTDSRGRKVGAMEPIAPLRRGIRG